MKKFKGLIAGFLFAVGVLAGAAVPTVITDTSSTAASNSPAGSENVFPNLDDYLRAHAKFIRDLYDGTLTISGKTFTSPLGTVGAPTYSFTGDTDTGLWSPAANTLAASTSGAETWRTLSTGEFLVKRTTTFDAAYKFQVGDGAGDYRSLFNPNTTFAIGVRNGASTNGVYFLGASAAATPDLLFSNTGGTERFRMTDDGRIYGTALHNNSGAVTGATFQYIASGTYTPTLTNTTNVASSTARASQWMRVGNVVTVTGAATVTPSVGSSPTALGISLPIASTFTTAYQLAGTTSGAEASSGNGGFTGPVIADTTNNRAIIKFTSNASNLNAQDSYYTFSYEVR
jgi:hypothetical protein